jgi:hypothetical protein
MSEHMAKAEELIALSARLTAIIDDDIATLKNKRPAQLARSDADRSMAMLQYSRAVAEFRSTGGAKSIPAPLKQRLNSATQKLMNATREQGRLLTRFRHVTEGLIKAVADVVIARETPSVYAKTGTIAKTGSASRGAAMTLNQAV